MVNFRQLVESLLLEGLENHLIETNNFTTFNQQYNLFLNVKNIKKDDLEFVWGQIKSNSYIAGKNWKHYIHCFPILFAIDIAFNSIKPNNLIDSKITTLDDFISKMTDGFSRSNDKGKIVAVLDTPLREYSNKGISIPVNSRSIYNNALLSDSYEVLRQDVYPLIQNMTITDAVSNIIQKRLSGMEKMQLKWSFSPPLNILNRTESSFDRIMEKTIKKYNDFIVGKYSYSQEFQTVLQQIDITLKDFAEIVHYTRDIIKPLIYEKLGDPITPLTEKNREKATNDSVNNSDFVIHFCKTGELKYFSYDNSIKIYTHLKDPSNPTGGEETVKFILKEIESIGSTESSKLIEIIKEMSTGVRAKSQAWQKFKEERFQYLTQAAGSLTAFGGAKLYG